MKIKKNFEMVSIGDDYILVPVGDEMDKFNGTVILNDISAFLIEKLMIHRTEEELVDLIVDEYEVDRDTAKADTHAAIEKMKDLGVIDE